MGSSLFGVLDGQCLRARSAEPRGGCFLRQGDRQWCCETTGGRVSYRLVEILETTRILCEKWLYTYLNGRLGYLDVGDADGCHRERVWHRCPNSRLTGRYIPRIAAMTAADPTQSPIQDESEL